MKRILLFLIPFLFAFILSPAQAPWNYWDFDSGAPENDKMGNYNLVTGGQILTVLPGQVNNALQMDASILQMECAPTGTFSTAISIEFIYKSNHRFDNNEIIKSGNGFVSISLGWPIVGLSHPSISFGTSVGVGGSHDMTIILDGLGIKNWGYYTDQTWHHIACTYDVTNGRKRIYVDGMLLRQDNAPTGILTSSGNGAMYFSTNTIERKLEMDIDEIATYKAVLSPFMVREHYDNMIAGNPYNTTTTLSTVITPVTSGPVSADDYAVGASTVLVNYTVPACTPTATPTGWGGEPCGSIVNNMPMTNPGTRSALQQLQFYPLPRYKLGHVFPPNFDWMDIGYLGGLGQTLPSITTPPLYTQITKATSVTIGTSIAEERCKNWNQTMSIHNIGNGSNFADPASMHTAIATLADANPTWPLSVVTFRVQVPGAIITSKTLTPLSDWYFNDGAIPTYMKWDLSTLLITNVADRQLRLGLNTTFFNFEGDYIKAGVDALIALLPSRDANKKVDYLNDNGEWMHWLNPFGAYADPFHLADVFGGPGGPFVGNPAFTPFGFDSDVIEWSATRYKELSRLPFFDRFMNTTPGLQNTISSEYALEGRYRINDESRWAWEYSREIGTPWADGGYRSTGDFYPRWPYNWHSWTSAWHGLKWFQEAKEFELFLGDEFSTPFVNAGWFPDEEKTVRPAQYLGLLKTLGGMGAEMFYVSQFNIKEPHLIPSNYVWQVVMPSYAQAAISQEGDLFYNSNVIEGDYSMLPVQGHVIVPGPPSNSVTGSYRSFADDMRVPLVIRKHNTLNKYMIFGALMNNTNMQDALSVSKNVMVNIAGIGNMTIEVRRQGSIYVYDATGTDDVFYQLDGFHEIKHPDRWTQDIYMEGELYSSASAGVTKVTEDNTGLDYSTFTTLARVPNGESVTYTFQIPELAVSNNYHLWLRVRSLVGADCQMDINVLDEASGVYYNDDIGCVNNTNWEWIRRNADGVSGPIQFNSLATDEYRMTLTATNDIEIDQVVLIQDAGNVLGETITPCALSITASITPAAPVPNCYHLGNPYTDPPTTAVPQVFTALPAGLTYLWAPNGEVTQTIQPTLAGTYTVTVTDPLAGTSSASVVVTIDDAPQINPIPNVVNACPTATADLTLAAVVNLGLTGTSTWHITQGDAETGAAPIAAPTLIAVSGTYWLRILTAGGCFDVEPCTVTISSCVCASPPTADAGPNQLVCGNLPVTLAGIIGGNATLGTWTTTNGTGTFSNINNLTGTYTPSGLDIDQGSVTITLTTDNDFDPVNCTAASDFLVITLSTIPNATIFTVNGTPTISEFQYCQAGSLDITATEAGATYLWSTTALSPTINVTSGGTYTVTVTNAAGCIDTDAVTVVEKSKPTAVIDPVDGTSVCGSGSLTLNATTTAVNATFLWASGETTQAVTVFLPATYTVTVTSQFGCTDADAQIITNSCIGLCVPPVNFRNSDVSWHSMRFKWDGPVGEKGFQIGILERSSQQAYVANYTGTRRFIAIKRLNTGTTYEVRMRTLCNDDTYSTWSPTQNITTKGVAPP